MNRDHMVLIVDDDVMIGKVIASLLNKIDLSSVYASDGAEGLERLKSSSKPFSMIISDQRMPGMSGIEFLEQAGSIAPDAIRFLITGYADIHTMIDAVNRGAIDKYIAKPWQNEDFLASVRDGLEQYELSVENIHLFNLAKQQNSKLFELNRILKESAERQSKVLDALDEEIKGAQSQLQSRREVAAQASRREIRELLQRKGVAGYEQMNSLYGVLLSELVHCFRKKDH